MNGILLIDKSRGITSFQICNQIRKKFQIKRVGHGGTLDPEATGLLVVLLGKATRLFDSLQNGSKEYEGTIVLGESRNTQDRAGTVLEKIDETVVLEKATKEAIENTRVSFLGEQVQTAPLHSALKHKGKPLYYYARRDIAVEPKKRTVCFHTLEMGRIDPAMPTTLFFKSQVSKGTYLRSLAHDFGMRLGTLGYLGSLRRTHSGDFDIAQAHTLEEVMGLSPEQLEKMLIQYQVDVIPAQAGIKSCDDPRLREDDSR